MDIFVPRWRSMFTTKLDRKTLNLDFQFQVRIRTFFQLSLVYISKLRKNSWNDIPISFYWDGWGRNFTLFAYVFLAPFFDMANKVLTTKNDPFSSNLICCFYVFQYRRGIKNIFFITSSLNFEKKNMHLFFISSVFYKKILCRWNFCMIPQDWLFEKTWQICFLKILEGLNLT